MNSCRAGGFVVRVIGFALAMGTPVSVPAIAQGAPLTPFARQKAERMLRDKLECLGCHSLGGDGGVIAPTLDSVRMRRDPAYIAAIITEPTHVRPGAAMPKARLAERERTLIIRYLGGDPTAVYRVTAIPFVATDTTAAARYQKWCAACHGVTGKGDGPNATHLPVAPSRHADATVTALRSDDALFDTIYGGGAIMNRSARMPAFGATLSAGEIRGLVQHIRALCRCNGPAWSRGAIR